MGRPLFFDIDGTLVSFQTHEIPQSTIDALTRAKAAGCGIYIATGRPISFINNLGAIEHLIDGYMTTTGAYCFVGNHEVLCVPMLSEDVETIKADALAKNYAVIFSCEKDICIYNMQPVVKRLFEDGLNVGDLSAYPPYEKTLSEQRVLMATAFMDQTTEDSLMSRIGNCISGRWHPEFTDISPKSAGKDNGLRAMADYLGIDISETIAFGDGGNDISLLKAAGVGIAMGNAREDVKSVSDYVTSSVDEDGIANALKHFGII